MSRFEGRTEKPTPKRRRKARREGQVARSHEVAVAAGLAATLVWARVLFPNAAAEVVDGTRALFSTAGSAPPGAAVRTIAFGMLVAAIGPVLAIAAGAALVAGAAQGGVVFAPASIKPKLERLSPKQALQRFRPPALLWELVRTTGKLGVAWLVAWGPVQAMIAEARTPRPLGAWLALAGHGIWQILLRATIALAVIAAADLLVARFRTMRQLKMTKQEVREEHKQSEGDPMVRAARRRRHLELTRNRMIRDVATADVVITNPTHLCVALSYAKGDRAPKVVAKGAGRFALKLRKIAARHGVLVTEDKPLARTLYRRCRVGQEIPVPLYEAVALLLAAAYRRRRLGAA